MARRQSGWRGSLEPVLYREAGNPLKVTDVSGHDGQTAVEGDGAYSQVRIPNRRASALQASPHLAVTAGSCGIEGKDGKVG